MTHQILTRLTWSGVSQGTSVVMSTRGLSEGPVWREVGDRLTLHRLGPVCGNSQLEIPFKLARHVSGPNILRNCDDCGSLRSARPRNSFSTSKYCDGAALHHVRYSHTIQCEILPLPAKTPSFWTLWRRSMNFFWPWIFPGATAGIRNSVWITLTTGRRLPIEACPMVGSETVST